MSPITLKAGKNEIALLSMTVGLQVRDLCYSYVSDSFDMVFAYVLQSV